MSIDADDEILQDFLVEAGEILERLNEELVDLENRPDDNELLNAVFRSFHTIKGGASFLSLDGMVEVCHVTEDVFNVLRNGERNVDIELMDAVLKVLDILTVMFDEVHGGNPPTPADPALIEVLRGMSVPEAESVEQKSEEVEDESDAEFEVMVANTQGSDTQKDASASDGDEITEDEFDALLDDLHGSGKAPAAPKDADKPVNGNEISEDEFDALLDDLHGKGNSPSSSAPELVAAAPTKAVVAKVDTVKAPAVKPKKAAVMAKPKAETSVRVDTQRLDQIMNLVGELVLARNRLANLKDSIQNEDMTKAIANLDVVTADLQSSVMKTRMQPIKKVFGRFPRVVRDLARSLNKEVSLVLKGEDTDLDKNLVEALADPLVHLVRNAVDHGIEMPSEREAAGKSRDGQVILAAEQEGDHILLRIEDDGKGMDPDKLRASAVAKGMMDEDAAARLDDKECFNLIFAAGFSTAVEVSDVSGRGVGMDVVKTRIGQLNGTVEIDSKLGRGSRILIRVPLTLAIMPTLMVKIGDQPYALPLGSVSEIFDLDSERTSHIDGQLVVLVRDKALPLYFLRDWLDNRMMCDKNVESISHVVVVNVGGQRVGFVVEQLVGQEEVVIKPLGAFLLGMAGFAGATITGDGRIALILDVPSMMKKHSRHL